MPGPRRRHQPADRHKQPPQTHWGQVAKWYDDLVGEEGSDYHRHVVLPGAVRLLDAKPGQRVLDVACGQGVLCRVLHRSAIEATGVDASKSLIHMAIERSDPAIRFVVADARDLSALPDEHYDAAACILAIQNIQPLEPVFQTVAGRLVQGGKLVVVMMHPVFRSPKATSWGFDDRGGVQYRRIDRYLLGRKEPIVTHPGSDPGRYTWTFHRPIETYVRAMSAAGLLVDAMEEWPSHKVSEPGPRAAAENTARKEIPMFLAIRAIKARSGQGPAPRRPMTSGPATK